MGQVRCDPYSCSRISMCFLVPLAHLCPPSSHTHLGAAVRQSLILLRRHRDASTCKAELGAPDPAAKGGLGSGSPRSLLHPPSTAGLGTGLGHTPLRGAMDAALPNA